MKNKQPNSNNVNSRNKNSNKTTVNSSTVYDQIESLLEEHNIKPEGVAIQLSEMLEDKDSVSYFELLIKEHGPAKLLEAAHITKDAATSGKIKTKKSIYFIGILKRWGLKTKFRKEG